MEVKYITGDLVRVEDSANWWTEDGTIMKISAVNCTDMVDVLCGSENYTVDIDDIVPIPLTFDILKNNGWSKVEERTCSGYECPDNWRLVIQNVDGRCVSYFHGELLCRVDYAHQLQHLLFGLGLNSEIKV